MVRTTMGDEERVDLTTRLVSLSIPSLSSAHRIIGQRTKDGSLPLMLLPRRAPTWWMMVPEGFYALLYKGGRNMGSISPGLHILSPLYKVQYLVSKQWTVFDTPVKQCSTKDNVYVEIDCIIVFRITDAEQFVVYSSPSSLQGLLTDKVQEAVRYLARQQKVEDIYSLSGAGHATDEMRKDFNETFNRYGVEVSQVTITHVAIPPQQAKNLEEISWFQTREDDLAITTEYSMLIAKLQKEKDENNEKLKHTRKETGEQLVVKRIAVEADIGKLLLENNTTARAIEAEVSATVEQIKIKQGKLRSERSNEQNKRVTEITTTAETAVNEIRSEAKRAAQEALAQAETESKILVERAEQELQQRRLEAERARREKLASAKLTAAELQAQALELRAEAEEAGRKQVEGRRAFELKQKELDVLETMTSNRNLMVHGESGMITIDRTVPYQGPEYKHEQELLQQKATMLEDVVAKIVPAAMRGMGVKPAVA